MFKFNTYLSRPFLKLNQVEYGKKLRLIGYPFIFRFPNAKIKIGNQVTINSNFWSNLLGLNHKTIIIAKREGKIKIGDRVGISGGTIYAWDSVIIGNDTLLGANVTVMDNDFHPIDANARMANDTTKVKTAPVTIGNNVFIGMNSIILKGTTIGDHCVVGAGSVVHGTFPSHCVIAGNPAKIVKMLEENENA